MTLILIEGEKGLCLGISFLSDPIFLQIIAPIISGFIAAALFLFFIAWVLRPKMEISADISRCIFQGVPTNCVKVVNKTLFPVIDIRLSAELHTEYFEHGETIKSSTEIFFKSPQSFLIQRNKIGKDTVHDNAIRFSFKDNLDRAWTDHRRTYLVVNMSARHSVSNISKVFTKTYKSQDMIKNGTFEFGNSCSIIESSEPPIINLS